MGRRALSHRIADAMVRRLTAESRHPIIVCAKCDLKKVRRTLAHDRGSARLVPDHRRNDRRSRKPLRRAARRRTGEMAVAAGHAGGSGRSRHHHGRCRPPDRRSSQGCLRAAVRGREQGRRWRDARRPLCRARATRRLHAPRGRQHHAFVGAVAVQDRAVRSGRGFHADRSHRAAGPVPQHQPAAAVQDRPGDGGVRQGQSRQVVLRPRQRQRPDRRRDPQVQARPQHSSACPIPATRPR